MNLHVRYALIVTPTYTYAKYSFTADEGAATVTVSNPRTHEQMNVLTSATVTEVGPKFYRIEGRDAAGDDVVWSVDTPGWCQSCRQASRITDTDPSEIPT